MPRNSARDTDSFFEQVYAVVRLVPYGRVTSYGAIAGYLGTRGSARMVGWAMNAAHTAGGQANGRTNAPDALEAVPAHRVVNRHGLLTGKHHFGHPGLMQQLLENEGIEVAGDRVVHFSQVFWDPAKELV